MNAPTTPTRFTWTLIALAFLLVGASRPTALLAQPRAVVTTAQASELGEGLSPGDRIRISTIEGGTPVEGELYSLSDASLTLTLDDGSTRDAPISSLALVERYSEERNFFKRFLPITGVGAGTFALLGAVSWEPCEGWCILHPDSRTDAFIMGAAIGAVLLAPVGIVAGLLGKDEVWNAVSVPGSSDRGRSVDVRLVPTRSGVSLGASIRLGGGS
jgi:hypothetical protein